MLPGGAQEALGTVRVFEFVVSNKAAKGKSQTVVFMSSKGNLDGYFCLFLDSLKGAFKVLELWAAFSLD